VLAFDPTRRTIERIHNFVKENIGIGYILDIEIYHDVLGGAIVIFNGKYKDFTLKKNLEEVYRLRRSEVLPNRT
jgi:F0F1-type ATP synthase delta subunit